MASVAHLRLRDADPSQRCGLTSAVDANGLERGANVLPETVRVFEMAPRDGLQNEARAIPTADKIKLVDLLSDAGLREIEVTSFVSPKWVPQLADAAEVMAGIRREPGVNYAVLTPNMRGYDAAVAARADTVAVFASASEGFSQNNINCSIAESFARFAPILKQADADGTPVRGYISCVVACPFDGPIAPDAVADIARQLLDAGCYEISLGDTIGVGTPDTVARLLGHVVTRVPAERLAGHYHDTNGRACDNIEVSLAHGLRCYDAAVGGLGGCPYAPGAAGNVATEKVLARLVSLGFETTVDIEKIEVAAAFANGLRETAHAV